MYFLGDILGKGYQAHVLLYRSVDRINEAVQSLEVSEESEDNSVAALIEDLMGGDIAAQAQLIYSGNTAISMFQTLDQGVERINDFVEQMRCIVQDVATDVYDAADVGQMQFDFEDLALEINQVACSTSFAGQKLLCEEDDSTQVYLINGVSIEAPAVDLRFSVEGLDLASNHSKVALAVQDHQVKTNTYHERVQERLTHMQHQVALADTETAKVMEFGMDEPNLYVAEALAQDLVADILSQQVVALKSQANVNRNKVPRLLYMNTH
ncbi:hypothetical protein ACFL6U_13975 [Planctomycetota bacterium]